MLEDAAATTRDEILEHARSLASKEIGLTYSSTQSLRPDVDRACCGRRERVDRSHESGGTDQRGKRMSRKAKPYTQEESDSQNPKVGQSPAGSAGRGAT